MKKAVLYLRASEKNENKNKISIEIQKNICKKLVINRRFDIDKIFIDTDCPANDLNRPEFQKMLKYCGDKNNKVKAVFTASLDRIIRNYEDFVNIILPLFKENNIKLYTETTEADLIAVYNSRRELQADE